MASSRKSRVAAFRLAVPLFLCSFALYVATLVALSYFPGLVGYKIFGSINLAYVLALAQFCLHLPDGLHLRGVDTGVPSTRL